VPQAAELTDTIKQNAYTALALNPESVFSVISPSG